MNKKALIKRTIVAFILVGFIVAFLSLAPRQDLNGNQDLSTVCFDNSCIEIELAQTSQEITKGLMHRTELCESCGMLFIFKSDGTHKFWMKNTLIPLDIIWMDADGQVVYIERDAQPCDVAACPTFGSSAGSLYVLEVNAGYVLKHGIDVGDDAQIFLSE